MGFDNVDRRFRPAQPVSGFELSDQTFGPASVKTVVPTCDECSAPGLLYSISIEGKPARKLCRQCARPLVAGK